MRGIQTCARACIALFALGLVFSAVAKSLGPRAAAAGLLWTGLGPTGRAVLVLFASFVECLVGGVLLVGGRCRPVLWLGAGLAVVLLALHAVASASSSGCGCFGEVPVPDAVSLGLLVLGLLGCVAGVRSAGAFARWPRAGLVLAFSLAVPALALPELSRETRSMMEELRSILGIERTERAVVIVGTWSCDDCHRALQDTLRRSASGEQVFFVTRTSEGHAEAIPSGSFVHGVIPDDVWWSFVVSSPPRIVRFQPDAVARGS